MAWATWKIRTLPDLSLLSLCNSFSGDAYLSRRPTWRLWTSKDVRFYWMGSGDAFPGYRPRSLDIVSESSMYKAFRPWTELYCVLCDIQLPDGMRVYRRYPVSIWLRLRRSCTSRCVLNFEQEIRYLCMFYANEMHEPPYAWSIGNILL